MKVRPKAVDRGRSREAEILSAGKVLHITTNRNDAKSAVLSCLSVNSFVHNFKESRPRPGRLSPVEKTPGAGTCKPFELDSCLKVGQRLTLCPDSSLLLLIDLREKFRTATKGLYRVNVNLMTTEIVVFDWAVNGESPVFCDLLALIKSFGNRS